jgi:hypothetical protein
VVDEDQAVATVDDIYRTRAYGRCGSNAAAICST